MSYTSSGTPITLICSGCGRSLAATFYQIGERYLCSQCLNVAQVFQSTSPIPLPDYSADWLKENARLRAEIEALKARQIPPEIEQMCEDFIGQRDTDSNPMSQRKENSFARSIGLKLVQFVEALQIAEGD